MQKNIFGIITSSNNYDQAYNLNKEIYDEIYKKFEIFIFWIYLIINYLQEVKVFKKKNFIY